MTIKELAAITQSLGPAIREYVGKSIDAISDRIVALEQKALTPGPKGEPGEKGDRGEAGERGIDGEAGEAGPAGRDATVDLGAVARQAAALIPAPKDGDPGQAGKDAEVDLQDLAARAAALIPIPKDGAPGAIGEQGLPGRDADINIDGLAARAAALIPIPKDGAPGAQGPSGDTGPAGKDAPDPDYAVIASLAAELIPVPKDGAPGHDGKDADVEAVAALVLEKCTAAIEKAVSERLEAAVAVALTKAIDALPRPKDGAEGAQGKPGEKGRDGAGVMGAIINKDGQLILTMSDGRVCEIGVVMGQKGDPGTNGTNGLDGLGFDNLDASFDEQGHLVLRMANGERAKLFVVPGIVDRGVFRDGEPYLKGDGVTWDGSWFIAQKDTTTKPGTSSDWRLAVKRGRDGRDWKK